MKNRITKETSVRAARFWLLISGLCIGFILWPDPVEAYVGPGAGFAFVFSFFILLVSFLLAFVTLLTWPFRWILATLRGRRALRKSRYKKVVIVGLDGQDPLLTERFMEEGMLPNFSRLKKLGSYNRLQTTFPSESPVAWSSFQTGSNPGRHRIFDFFVPNRKNYLPELASAEIGPPLRKISFGKYAIPLGKPRLMLKRKSQAFWKVLSDYGIFSTILRVPITFPPEKFKGLLLASMSVPDLCGTQGTFSYYTSDPEEQARFTGGVQIPIEVKNGKAESYIAGPPNPLLKESKELRIHFEVSMSREEDSIRIKIGKDAFELKKGEYSPWKRISFKAGLGIKIRGICRFYLKEVSPFLKLYLSPLNIDPEKPGLPISHPFTYSIYLAKTQGDYCTLGLSEDTWALNERVLDEDAFLKQTLLIHEEREKMFFDALEKTERGALVCVFDITDRMQHMFWRYMEEDHPANEGKDIEQHKNAMQDLYRRADDLVGRVIEKVDDETLLIVMSDHGFKSFQRGVNLNTWLYQKGLLKFVDQPSEAEWFQGVDWENTKAFAMGLGGIYLNVEGREAKGCVKPEEMDQVKSEIIHGLESLIDPKREIKPVTKVYDLRKVYTGPYVDEAPDLLAGFRPGHRVSWASAQGATTPEVFEDNTKSWSGDHCVNPPDVPGILFSNQVLNGKQPSIIDIAPTVLDVFGVPIPPFIDGKSLIQEEGAKTAN
jgi:predicted AlkP superfamily phosphohydrolase/phosphomutase